MSSPQRTWDGLEIASDKPTGASVVVRRPSSAGDSEFLVLHRNANGPDYEGDWAWTAPAGCRQPGEPAYGAALRELAEEAGIVDVEPWAVDLSSDWVVFALDVAADTAVELVDPEHDRFEWLSPAAAVERVLPVRVGRMIDRVAAIPPIALAFRPMRATDFADVARWQQAPHARQWFASDGVHTEADAMRKYRPRVLGEVPVRMWVVEVDGTAVGFVQDYRVRIDDDYAAKTGRPDAVAFDYLIGDSSLVGRGIGTRMVWEFCRDVLRRDYPDAEHFLASPSHRNKRSLRALEKCGFTPGVWIDPPAPPGEQPDTEVACTLDVPHWFGTHRAWFEGH